MPRKRRASPNPSTRATKKRRLDRSEEKEEDVVMSQEAAVDTARMHARSHPLSLENIGGLIPETMNSDDFVPEFQPGAIKSLEVKNWVTFDESKFEAAPGLNLIMGPNGTGKSSLVCAICMALNGKTSTLGRVDRIGDFVKRGEHTAIIEIVLKNFPGKPDIIIRRTVKKTGASAWKLNGKKAGQKDIAAIVKKLRIKVDNLCQFLAQDRVQEFARLTPEELLHQTLKAVASEDDNLVEQHQQLQEMQTDLTTREQEMKTVEANLAASREQLRGLETVISNFRTRETMKQNLEIFNSRIAWAKVEEAEQEAARLKAEKDVVQRKLREDEHQLNPFVRRQTSWQRKETKANGEVTASKKKNESMMQKYKRLEKKHEKFNEDMKESREEIKDLRKRAADQDKKRQKLENELRKLRTDFDKMNPETIAEAAENKARLRGELRRARQEQARHNQAINALKNRRGVVQNEIGHVQNLMRSLQDTGRQRAEAIYRGDKRKFKQFAAWVESNRHQFEGEVVGPIISTMDVQEQLHANYLNTAIRPQLLYAWVTRSRNDWSLLSREAKRQRLFVLVLHTEPDNLRNYTNRRVCPTNVLQQHGASGYLDEIFDAPDMVKCVLCNEANIHRIAYADSDLSQPQRQNLLQTRQNQANTVQRLFEPREAWTVKFSRYDREAITTTNPVRVLRSNDPGLHPIVDVSGQIEDCRAQIEDHKKQMHEFDQEMKGLNNESKPLTRRINALNAEREQWGKKEQVFKKAKNKITRTEAKLRDVSEPIDIEAEEEEFRVRIRTLAKEQMKTMVKMIEIMDGLVVAHAEYREAAMKRDHAFIEKEAAGRKLQQLRNRQKKLKKDLAILSRQFNDAKAEKKDLEGAARRQFPRNVWEPRWTEEEHLSKTLAELDVAAEDLKSRIACVLCNENDVKRYQQLDKQVVQFEKQAKDNAEVCRRLEEQLIQIEETWRPRIREMITKVSRRFQELFHVFNANGEVRLREMKMYAEWAVDIMADFRPHTGEGFQALSGFRQSGGEKSVSTMLYLLSLQEVSTAPFRVVDEINQGMDPVNERLIMKILNQECVPRENREVPQYFVVSPKLLPRLQYSPHSAAFMIFNGPWVTAQELWDVEGFIEDRASQSQSGL